MVRFILFLVRLKLGVRKWEGFRFTNQKSDNIYLINSEEVLKIGIDDGDVSYFGPSNVSINWLLNPMCVVEKVMR